MLQRDQHGLIGDSAPFRRLMKTAQVVAATDANLLLQGEEGTGKEVVARAIHRMSPRRDRPFLTVACTGLAESRIESELGGGGLRADGGSLFLDAVGELPPAGQSHLLRVLERGQEGSRRPRVIAATSQDLWSAVEAGSFRRDLYYRLYVVPLGLPPLRDRVQDIPLLLEHLLRSAADANRLDVPRFTAAAERQLRRYVWPGNVRELKNFCERMVILFSGREVGPENLPWEIRRGDMQAEENLLFKLPSSGINLKDLEAEAIRQALALAGGNKSRAARLLGLSRDTLLYRLQKYLIKA